MSDEASSPGRSPERADPELEQAREILARTVRFLARCAEDPASAMSSEDPRALMQGLEDLAAERQPKHPIRIHQDSSPIQIRRRRSA
jgi:hypothetical protein